MIVLLSHISLDWHHHTRPHRLPGCAVCDGGCTHHPRLLLQSFDISAGASGRKTTISDYRELKVASADEWIALIKKYREL
jgi:hypothetical protein